jgi:hypothetical protein
MICYMVLQNDERTSRYNIHGDEVQTIKKIFKLIHQYDGPIIDCLVTAEIWEKEDGRRYY